MKIKLFFALVAIISSFDGLQGSARIKPKDYDQKMSAASYYYRTEHVEPPHSFVTGNSFPSKSGYYTAARPISTFSSSGINQPSGGSFSYVSNHGGSSGSSSIDGGLGHSSPIIVEPSSDTLPLHRPISVEVNDDSGESAVSQEVLSDGDVGSYDGGSEVDSGSYEVAPLSSGHYTHGTFHHANNDGDHGSSFSKGAKNSHGSEYYERKGNKGNKSYDKAHKETQGKKGHYDHAHESGHQADKGGKKNSHYDEGDQYASHHEEGHKKQGGKHGEKKHHKKVSSLN